MSQHSVRPAREAGFSLIEIMVVLVILGILASVIVPRVMDSPDKARVTKARSDVSALENALHRYKMDNFNYPSTDQGLAALVEQPGGTPEARNWQKGGYINRLPKDPWGNDYQYLNPGAHGEIDIFSYGADGAEGGEEIASDIGNWGE